MLAALLAAVLVMGASPALADDTPDEPAEPAVAQDSGTIGIGADRILNRLAVLARMSVDLDAAEPAEGEEAAPTPTDLFLAGYGLGDIFKITVMQSLGVEVDLEAMCETPGACEFEWGEFLKSLDPEQLEKLEGLPRNLGAVVSASKDQQGRPDNVGKPDEAGKPDHAGKPEDAGKPDHAGKPDDAGKPDRQPPAHGRDK
jgi:hypothetical protein